MELKGKNKYGQPIGVVFADDHLVVWESIISFIEMFGGIKVIIEAENGKTLIVLKDDQYALQMIRLRIDGCLLKNCASTEIKKALITIRGYSMYFTDFFTLELIPNRAEQQIKLAEHSETERQFLTFSSTEMSYAEIAKKMKIPTKKEEGYQDKFLKKTVRQNKSRPCPFAHRYNSGSGSIKKSINPISTFSH